ncbi:MAG: HNH endonuclease [Candidatus Peribacteria bacterium]|nr:MAG: HNH endonuclease [Candidatus Peribacteria bacterium]
MKTCIYCGSTKDITREHVIPYSFFDSKSDKSTEDLITVPACLSCNQNY